MATRPARVFDRYNITSERDLKQAGEALVSYVNAQPRQRTPEEEIKTLDTMVDLPAREPVGNDVGTRSGIYTYNDEQKAAAEASRDDNQQELSKAGYAPITTEIVDAPEFYYAEDYHQQYLAKNPAGYCRLGGTGITCPVSA